MLLPCDVVASSDAVRDAAGLLSERSTPLGPEFGFPRDWPDVFKQSKVLKRLVNREIKGIRWCADEAI